MPIAPHPEHRSARNVNPEAGDHLVTADPAEAAAAERAVRRSWRDFPYYAHRYDARGRRFSASDSGWLVTLCALGEGAAVAQIHWLAEVLAARGMPRWLLECHLEALHDELVQAIPERAAHYAPLLAAAHALRARRQPVASDERLRLLDAAFTLRVGPALAKRHRRMGAMIAAAAADERDGLTRAVPSLLEWVADPERFPAGWLAAVEETLAAARAW